MNQQSIIKKIRDSRSVWIDLEEGKKIQVIRPTELQVFQKFYKKSIDGKMEFSLEFNDLKEFIVAWDGFTEADILGNEIGASDKIEYHQDLFDEYLSDRIEWVNLIASSIMAEIEKAQTKKADSVKK